jgi:hypothetical protein
MLMNRTNILRAYGLVALTLVALISSCGGSSNPAAPSSTGGAVLGDVLRALPPDGLVTLKVAAPTLQSPPNNSETVGLTPTVTVASPRPTFIPDAGEPVTVDFQFFKNMEGGLMAPVGDNRSVIAAPGITSYAVPAGELEQTSTYMWRARARIGNEYGKWSDAWSFLTPTLVTIGAPTPLSPANGSEVSTSRPDLIVTNGAVSPSAGAVAIEYQIDNDLLLSSPSTFQVAMGASGTTSGVFEDALQPGVYGWRARATNGTVVSDWSDISTFTFSTSSGPRTADPPPGQKLPLPNESALINAVAAEFPEWLENSCTEDGGSWDFMDEAVRRLRLEDTRWGWNCKRGDCNHISIDVVDYHYGAGQSDGSDEVYIIDIILAVCPTGSGAAPAWINQTGTGAGAWIYPR